MRVASGQTNHKHYEKSDAAEKAAPTGELAPRLQSLARHRFPVTTRSPKAQLFINQGMNLAYGFNHAEAARQSRISSPVRTSRK